MNDLAIEKYFLKIIDEDKNMSNGIAAIKTLLVVLEKTNCKFHHIKDYFLRKLNFYQFLFSHDDSRACEHNQVGCDNPQKQRETDNFGMLCKRTFHLFHHARIAEARR